MIKESLEEISSWKPLEKHEESWETKRKSLPWTIIVSLEKISPHTPLEKNNEIIVTVLPKLGN